IPKQLETWRERILQFLFPVESDTWLGVLRLGLGLQVIVYTLSLRGDWNYLLAGTGHGLISRNLAEALLSVESRFVPRLGWLVSLGAYVGLSENAVLSIAWVCLLGTGFSLLAGLFCRSSAILAWFLHLCAAKRDRKSTRLNSSHVAISYAVFCLKKKKNNLTYIMLEEHIL